MTNSIDSLPPAVIDAWRRGDKIEAIKRLRQATGVGLAEAKGVIDRLDGDHAGMGSSAATKAARRDDGLAPGEVPRSKGALGIAILVIVAAVGAWLYSRLA